MDLKQTPPKRTFVAPPPRAKISLETRASLARGASASLAVTPVNQAVVQTAAELAPVPEPEKRSQTPLRASQLVETGRRTAAHLASSVKSTAADGLQALQSFDYKLLKSFDFWRSKDWRHPNLHSLGPTVVAVVALFGFSAAQALHHDFYQLTPASQAVIGRVNQPLSKKVTYNKQDKAFQYNQQAAPVKPDSPQAAIAAARKAQTTQKVGGGANNYAASLAADSAQGVNVSDTSDESSSLAVSLIPQFKTRAGKLIEGRVLYPIKGRDATLVYSVKANGLKEDIVLPEVSDDTADFAYKLKLPDSLQARLLPNGNVGVFSADSALFGSISYGTPEDQARVEAARKHGIKNHLAFVIPAPVITQSGTANNKATAEFSLEDDVLTIHAKNLKQASYPISIDPSVVVTSASDFTKGNFEGGIDIDTTNNQIKRNALTGGTTNAWHYTHASTDDNTTFVNGTSVARTYAKSFVANGFIYVIGGGGSDVTMEYAQLNSNGTVGTWTTNANNLIVGRDRAGFAYYNGYVYYLGGYNSGAYKNEVQYAKVNTNGSIGVWHYTHNSTDDNTTFVSGFFTARLDPSVVAYNGYIYIMGGCTADNLISCTAYTNDVQYAPLNANGTVGVWHYTYNSADNGTTQVGGFNTARYGQATAVYNGYIYLIGGLAGAGYQTDIQYAPLNADGTIGTWKTNATGFSNQRLESGGFAYNGYLYIIGGNNGGTILTDVQYGSINADGSVGATSSANGLVSARYGNATTFYNGYVYSIGGNNGSASQSDVQYAKIDSAGITGTFANGGNNYSATARYGAASVAYNGCLYVIGGSNINTSTDQLTILYASLAGNGTVGTWATNANNYSTTGRTNLSAVAYGGYMYVIGGVNNGTTYSAEVNYALFNTGSCGTGGFSATNALGTARALAGATAVNGVLYVGGGANNNNTTVLASVEYAALGSNGAPAAFTTTTALPTARRGLALASSNGYVYAVGGSDSGGVLTEVRYALACTGNNSGVAGCSATAGTLGTWNSTTSLTSARVFESVTASKGYMYVYGGNASLNNTTAPSSVASQAQYAQINADGTLGSWTAVPVYSTARMFQASVFYNGYMYIVGGCTAAALLGNGCDNSTALADVQYAPVNNGGNGSVGSYASAGTDYSPGRTGHTSVAYNGYLYIIGGWNGTTYYADVQYAQIKADGKIGAWTATTSLGVARTNHTTVLYNGYIYVIGGAHSTNDTACNGTASPYCSDVQYALICTGLNSGIGGCGSTVGTIGTWNSTTSFSTARYGHMSAAYNGYVYVMGGCNSFFLTGCNGVLSDVQYAQINANGTLGSWTTTTALPAQRAFSASLAYNGYVYVVGGNDSTGTNNVSTVYVAPLNTNGTVGAWQVTNSYYYKGRYSPALVAADGYMYLTGGNDASINNTDTLYAHINPNGTLGPWNISGSNFTNGRNGHTSVIYDGYIYVIGGYNGTTAFADTQYAGLKSITRKGMYSSLSDISGDGSSTKIIINGVNQSTTVGMGNMLAYQLGPNATGSFGSTTNLPVYSVGSLTSFITREARYRLLKFTLDDSQNAVFPDALSAPSTITDFELFFHPASGQRLRGGKTFTGQGTATGLDAQP